MDVYDTPVARRLRSVKHIIIVCSGKGGVGKSSVAAQLALNLCGAAKRVGILDVDLTGPSIPRMLGLDGHGVHQSSDGWVPVYTDVMTPHEYDEEEAKKQTKARLACMSVGFLLKKRGDSVVWRGPKKNAMIRQFLSDVRWGELDYLIIDTPPGTSDEHLSLMEHLRPLQSRLSAVVVTTPQAVALLDATKCLSFARAVSLRVLGLVENMSGYVCPCCGEASNVFSTGGGEDLARREGVPFLGRLPVDAELVTLLDAAELQPQPGAEAEDTDVHENYEKAAENVARSTGSRLWERYKATPSARLFEDITTRVTETLSITEGLEDG